MNGFSRPSALEQIMCGAVIGALLAFGALIVALSFMGHGGTGPMNWASAFAVAGFGAAAGAVLSAFARLVDGPTGSWPSDTDGEILRGLAGKGFDFSQVHTIQYNVAFEGWPPPRDAIETLRSMYSGVEIIEPNGTHRGHAQFQIRSFVS
jgi:hypothetical protein